MGSANSSVEKALVNLQRAMRAPLDPDEPFVSVYRRVMPIRLQNRADREMLALGAEEKRAVDMAVTALSEDLEFEHLEQAFDAVWEFAASAWRVSGVDHVPSFLAARRRDVLHETCFLTVQNLTVDGPWLFAGACFLPPDGPGAPPADPWLGPLATGCLVGVEVVGTSLRLMHARARDRAEHALRLLLLALRTRVDDRQVRFQLGAQYSFGGPLSGFVRPAGEPIDLHLSAQFAGRLAAGPTSALPFAPADDVHRKADTAVRWVSRAVLADDPLVAVLFYFFALEALLGDKSEKLKAHTVAFRQMTLGHAVDGGFSHPETAWLLYDRVRSGAVHGEVPETVDPAAASRFCSTVCRTLDQYLTLAEREGIVRRGRLMAYLDGHADYDELREWLRAMAALHWDRFFAGNCSAGSGFGEPGVAFGELA